VIIRESRASGDTSRPSCPARWIGCAVVALSLATGCASGTQGGEWSGVAPAASSTGASSTGAGAAANSNSAGPGDSFDGNPVAVTSPLQVSVTYPFLIPDPLGSPDYFPTVFAHLLGQTITWTDISTSLACVSLTNPTGTAMQATLQVDLVGYSTPVEEAVVVPANYTITPCLSPTPTLDALYALSAPIPGQVHTTVTSQGSTTPLLDDVHAVTITTGQTVFNGEEIQGTYRALYQYQAVLSMPKDPWVQSLLTPAAKRSAWGTFGVGGYSMHVDENGNPIPRNKVTVAIPGGGLQSETVSFAAGESISLTIDGVACESCGSQTIDFYALEQASAPTTSTLSLDGAPLAVVRAPGSTAGQHFTITAPSGGQYQLMFFNSSQFATNVTYQRTGTQADTVLDALQAVYSELQSWNITYVSIASSYFDPFAAQSVRWPSTIHADLAANCIDGSMLFASILEALQLEPVVVFIPGHAFIGVRQSAGAELLWPVETTMMGTSPFAGALSEGTTEYNNKAVPPIAEMDIKAARMAGLLPIPD
jgi:hypothetical protein